MPAATAAVFRAGWWFLTGDIGYLDEEGILYITDRKKDIIIMSGWKIYPTEVENVIIQHPAVADVVVFGVPDECKGEVLVAAVVLKSGTSLTLSESDSYCRVHLAGYKIPRTMKVVSSFPGCMDGGCCEGRFGNHSMHHPSIIKKQGYFSINSRKSHKPFKGLKKYISEAFWQTQKAVSRTFRIPENKKNVQQVS